MHVTLVVSEYKYHISVPRNFTFYMWCVTKVAHCITGSTQEDPSQHERKTVDGLLRLILVLAVCKGYQQTTLGGKEFEWIVHKS